MTTVHIEHAVQDFDNWKTIFDRFSDMRTQHRVRRYDVSRPIDDPNFVMIRLDFDSHSDADAFLATMRDVWGAPTAATVLASTPLTRVTEFAEAHP